MKKLILAMMLLVPMGLAAQTQNLDDLITKYEDTEGYVCMNLSGDMLKNAVGTNAEAADAMKDISSMKMIIAEKATEEFRSDVEEILKGDRYTSQFSMNAEGNNVRFFILTEDVEKSADQEKEMLLIVSSSYGNFVIIGMKGKGDPAEMAKYINL